MINKKVKKKKYANKIRKGIWKILEWNGFSDESMGTVNELKDYPSCIYFATVNTNPSKPNEADFEMASYCSYHLPSVKTKSELEDWVWGQHGDEMMEDISDGMCEFAEPLIKWGKPLVNIYCKSFVDDLWDKDLWKIDNQIKASMKKSRELNLDISSKLSSDLKLFKF